MKRAPARLHTHILYTLLVLATAPLAQAQEAGPLDGLWRVTGVDRNGDPYADLLEVFQNPGGLNYERRPIAGFNGVRQTLPEVGEVQVIRRRVFTRQQLPKHQTGLLTAFRVNPNPVTNPSQRYANYTVAGPDSLHGVSFVPQTLHVGRERIERIRDNVNNNDVQLLIDGDEYFPLLRRELSSAQRSICLQTFIYTDDATGRSIAQLLMERARAGVEVRVLVDSVNTTIKPPLQEEMRRAGVELIFQQRWRDTIVGTVRNTGGHLWRKLKASLFGRPSRPRERRGLFNHDHRKITVVDGRVAFVGGMNIAAEYEHEWHDIQARVVGNAVSKLEDMFYDRWRTAYGVVGRRPEPDPAVTAAGYRPGNMSVDVLVTLPGLKVEILDRYIEEIDRAQTSIHIESAYFLDDRIISGLKRKARSGVDTVVILPNNENHDVGVVRDAFNYVQNDVVRSGVRLYKYRGPMTHSKVAVFDGRVATVGSANLDAMALQKLAEVNIFVNDVGFAQEMERRVFVPDVPRSERVRVEQHGWWVRTKSRVLHFIRTLL